MCIVCNILVLRIKRFYSGTARISYILVCAIEAKMINTSEQYTFHAFVEALKAFQMALAENSGLSPIDAFVGTKAQ